MQEDGVEVENAMLRSVVEKALAYRSSKGFEPATWDNATTRIACMDAEMSEVQVALSAVRLSHMKFVCSERRHVEDEIADVALYTLTLAYDLGEREFNWNRLLSSNPPAYASPSDMCEPARAAITKTLNCWRKGPEHVLDVRTCLQFVLLELVQLHGLAVRHASSGRIDGLCLICETKLEKMKDRPHLHGGRDPRS